MRGFAKVNIHSDDSDGELDPNSSDFGSEAFILLTLRETDNFLNQGTLSEGCHLLFRIWYRHAGPDFLFGGEQWMKLCEIIYFIPSQGIIAGSTFFFRACDLAEMMAASTAITVSYPSSSLQIMTRSL